MVGSVCFAFFFFSFLFLFFLAMGSLNEVTAGLYTDVGVGVDVDGVEKGDDLW